MRIEKKTLRNIFIGVITCIVLYWLLHETERVKSVLGVVKNIFAPFIVGSGLAFIINVPLRAFENLLKRIPNTLLRRTIALLLTFISVLLILSLVFWLLIPQLIESVESLLPKLNVFLTDIGTRISTYLEENPQAMEWLVNNTDIENLNWSSIVQNLISTVGNSVSVILSGTFSAISNIAGGVVDAFIAIVFSVYCLYQKETLARQGRKILYGFFPELFSDRVIRTLRLANSTFSNFLSGQCVEVCILGCLFAIAMAIFRMPYIPLVSILVAVTAFIPIVGAWVGCIFGAFFIFVSNPIQALWFIVMFIVIQQIENNLIYPRVVGTSIGLSGMWVLVAVAVGGELMGVAGMFLMIPVASVIQTILRQLTGKQLAGKEIAPNKLVPQPPELRSGLKERLFKKKKK